MINVYNSFNLEIKHHLRALMQQENLGMYMLIVSKACTILRQAAHQQYRYLSTKDYRKGKSYSSYDRYSQEDQPSSFRNRDS